VQVDKGPTPQYVSELSGLRHSEPMLRATQLSSAFACGAAAKPAKTTATKASDAHLVIFIPMFALHPL
jgi:hypothetical protein